MVFKRLQAGLPIDDHDFDAIYAKPMRAVSEIHFTPVDVAKMAAAFLVEKSGDTVLDVGSGAGKFCMIGATCTAGRFTGVEQRASLCLLAEQLVKRYHLSNLTFLCANITAVDFKGFDAIYFFNSFYENIFQNNPIDVTVRLDRQLYQEYSAYMKSQLFAMPAGTRLATYFSYLDEIPDSFEVQATGFDGRLKLWRKVR